MRYENNDIETAKYKEDLSGFIKGEPPNARMNSKGWKGVLCYNNGLYEKQIPLDMNHFIMRVLFIITLLHIVT